MKQEKFTILIVDDEEPVRKIVIKFLEHLLQATCYQAENGKKALEIYKQKQIDLVISDLDMPEMNGVELLHRLLFYDENAKVIIVSGRKGETISQELISQGAKKYLTKPINFPELVNSIKTIWKKYTDKLEEQ